ncbi:histidine phosphatase family protein [Paenibacillus puerhi]|uniref:histidine phosphatase family protein n=1 Tax=Paenibacillus puerhi TaxID=2692622 RepID=UPI0013585D7B|nr:histidine phosphatase family protein [Paenibacillus puerhi]
MKHIYLLRHGKAAGQEPEAPLTAQGQEDALQLVDFFMNKPIDLIYSSPYLRAVETILPFAKAASKKVVMDDRLRERVLSTVQLDDWMSKLEATYDDLELSFEGGESSSKAMSRGIGFIEEIWARPEESSIVVSHGALLSLIIKHYVPEFGFNEWKRMANPDIFHMKAGKEEIVIDHIGLSRE